MSSTGNNSGDRRRLLQPEGSDLSNASTAIDPPSPPRDTNHDREAQGTYAYESARGAREFAIHAIEPLDTFQHGLGINTGYQRPIRRVLVGSRDSLTPLSPPTPFSATMSAKTSSATRAQPTPVLSSPFQRYEQSSQTYDNEGQEQFQQNYSDRGKQRFVQSPEVTFDSTEVTPRNNERGFLGDDGNYYNDGCPSKHNIESPRLSWLSISTLFLSVYSTLFSGIWLVLAIIQPRYGRRIHSGGSLTPSTASIIFALFAKTIELSFVTVFVAFLGQVLSRRSIIKTSRGITIAELTMRTWVIQPGSMITHGQTLKHVGLSILGMITLTATFVAMFYTTASDALVSPHLKYGGWHNRLMNGTVKASYANPPYLAQTCQVPIAIGFDPFIGTTCLSIEHAGQAYHNSITYLDTWTKAAKGDGISTRQAQRPRAPAMLFDNTTVFGSWIETSTSDMTASFAKYDRIINNVTLAMPHAGVFAAARDRANQILQPEELDGVGEYSIRASVVSPAVNVLCANMDESEIAPLVYTTWPNAITNSSERPGQKLAWPGFKDDIQPKPGNTYLNSTVLDDIFEWGPSYKRQAPVFPMFPIEFNSVTNVSVLNPENHNIGGDSLYLFIKAPNASTSDYTLCQLRSFLSPACSTHYNVSGTIGGHLESHCEDPDDSMAYDKSVEPAPVNRMLDWRNVGSEWMLALSLNTGISNANAATSRLLAQFIHPTPGWRDTRLNPLMPSLAETLAVMVGSTLLLSSIDAQIYHYWPYNTTTLDPPENIPFNASMASQEFTSGYTQQWQAMFYLVLILVFATNVFCLVYFFVRAGLVTDFTEPQNLFTLAVNSPPSERLHGSCGAGPEGQQYNIDWHVSRQEKSGHFFIKEGDWAQTGSEIEMMQGRRNLRQLKTSTSYSKLSSPRKSWL